MDYAMTQLAELLDNHRIEVESLNSRIAELEKERDWLFDFAHGYTNIAFLNESLNGLKGSEG